MASTTDRVTAPTTDRSMASTTGTWQNRIFIAPPDVLKLDKGGCTKPLHLLNNSTIRLAFNLKSTRNESIKPSISSGFLVANGGCTNILLTYKPRPNEKPLNVGDRLTVLMLPAPEGGTNWEQCTLKNEKQCTRFVVKLRHTGTVESSSESESEVEG